jgi:hypothetical protein
LREESALLASAELTAAELSENVGPPTEGADLTGIWLPEGGSHLLRFGWDGTYAIDDSGLLGKDPDDVGTFEVGRKGTITFTSASSSRGCPEGSVSVWEEVRLEVVTLRGVVSRDACMGRAGTDWTWTRISA